MTAEVRRFAELIAYVLVLAMLLGAGITCLYFGKISDIFLGGIVAALPIPISAIARIGQSEAMNKMADSLAQSQPVARAKLGE